MKVTYSNNLYQITFHNKAGSVNCYLKEEDDYLTLVDTAMEEYADKIVRVARDIGKPLLHVVLTHDHHDHIGGLDKIKQLAPHIVVHMSNREERLVNGDRLLDKEESKRTVQGAFPIVQTKADRFLKEGDQVGSLIVIETPGHTPGSLSFLDSRTNSLLVGDALQTLGSVAIAGQMVPSFPYPAAAATWCKETALQSARKIQIFKPSLLAAGHGEMLEDPIEAISKAIELAEVNILHENNGQLEKIK